MAAHRKATEEFWTPLPLTRYGAVCLPSDQPTCYITNAKSTCGGR